MRDTGLVALFVSLALAPLPAQEPSNNRHPAVSADGQRIFFDSDRDGNSEIYVMNADGSNARRLTFDPGEDMGAERDADGWIVFARSEGPGTYPRTYLMSPDGSTFKELDNPESIHWAWSSDRRMVLKGSGQIGDNAISS